MIGTIDRSSREDVINEPETTSSRLFDHDPEKIGRSLRKRAISFGAISIIFAVAGIVITGSLTTG